MRQPLCKLLGSWCVMFCSSGTALRKLSSSPACQPPFLHLWSRNHKRLGGLAEITQVKCLAYIQWHSSNSVDIRDYCHSHWPREVPWCSKATHQRVATQVLGPRSSSSCLIWRWEWKLTGLMLLSKAYLDWKEGANCSEESKVYLLLVREIFPGNRNTQDVRTESLMSMV